MLFIVLLEFRHCQALLGYSFDKTSWLLSQNGWFILLLARACYPAKHVHLSSTYQDSETTKPLKRHSSRRMLVINHLPSEFQGPKDLPNKPKKHHRSSPCKSCSLPSEKLWTSHGFKPRPRRIQESNNFRYQWTRATQFSRKMSCSGPRNNTPRPSRNSSNKLT